MQVFILLLVVALYASPALSQSAFEVWKGRCSDFESLLNQKEKEFCNGFNFAIQNMPRSFPMILNDYPNIFVDDNIITNQGGQTLSEAPWLGGLMVSPDAAATIANPAAIEYFNERVSE